MYLLGYYNKENSFFSISPYYCISFGAYHTLEQKFLQDFTYDRNIRKITVEGCLLSTK